MTDYVPASADLLAIWHYRMKHAMAKANEIDNELVAHREALKAKYKGQGMDRFAVISRLSTDLDLQILLDDFKFYSGEIQRFGAMIQAEFAMACMFETYPIPRQRESSDAPSNL